MSVDRCAPRLARSPAAELQSFRDLLRTPTAAPPHAQRRTSPPAGDIGETSGASDSLATLLEVAVLRVGMSVV